MELTGLRVLLALLVLLVLLVLTVWMGRRGRRAQQGQADQRVQQVLQELRDRPGQLAPLVLTAPTGWMGPQGQMVPTEQWGPLVLPDPQAPTARYPDQPGPPGRQERRGLLDRRAQPEPLVRTAQSPDLPVRPERRGQTEQMVPMGQTLPYLGLPDLQDQPGQLELLDRRVAPDRRAPRDPRGRQEPTVLFRDLPDLQGLLDPQDLE